LEEELGLGLGEPEGECGEGDVVFGGDGGEGGVAGGEVDEDLLGEGVAWRE
jgi:hypothetical protein